MCYNEITYMCFLLPVSEKFFVQIEIPFASNDYDKICNNQTKEFLKY